MSKWPRCMNCSAMDRMFGDGRHSSACPSPPDWVGCFYAATSSSAGTKTPHNPLLTPIASGTIKKGSWDCCA
jgi:hypothetical protein